MKDKIEIFNQLVPYLVEQTGRGERGMDIYSRLLRERIIFIGMPIDDHIASLTIAQLIFLEAEDSQKDIKNGSGPGLHGDWDNFRIQKLLIPFSRC